MDGKTHALQLERRARPGDYRRTCRARGPDASNPACLAGRVRLCQRRGLPLIAGALNLTRAEVHGVVTFYHDFRREPCAPHRLQLCRAEACQSMGSEDLAAAVLAKLGVGWHGTTGDGELTVEPVYCLGLCATSPSALLDGEPLGRLNLDKITEALEEARAA